MTSGRDGSGLGAIGTLFESGTSLGMDDEQLLGQFLGKSGQVAEAAFEALVNRHGPMVLGVCRGTLLDPQDAQDAFQATFLVLARKAGSIRRRSSVASWLYGVARKIAGRAKADTARRRARERETVLSVMVHPVPGREPEDLAALYEEIDRLPGTYRDPIVLCYLDGMTYEAAAVHLDCPLGTLSVRLKRARERLRARLTRRGVTVPAGLLAAGLTPSMARAAVPVAWAKLAVRSSLAWALKRATVPGAVPAAVASLAERMMTTMRFQQAVAVGLLALGGVMLAATGSLAMKPTPAQTPTPQPRPNPKPKEPRSWVRTFPGGTTVELLGTSIYPSNPGSWRTPEGAPLMTPPYHHVPFVTTTTPQRQSWEVAYRVKNVPAGSTVATQGVDAMGQFIPEIHCDSITTPKEQPSSAIRFSLAAGDWKIEATGSGRDLEGHAREEGGIVFGTAREEGGKTSITIGEAISESNHQTVAVDIKGKEHGPSRMQVCGVANFNQMELEYSVPLAEIIGFRVKIRPNEWVTFGGVILKTPGKDDAPAK